MVIIANNDRFCLLFLYKLLLLNSDKTIYPEKVDQLVLVA